MTLPRRLALPPITTSRRRGLIFASAVVTLIVWLAVVGLSEPYDWARAGPGHDARPYWAAAMEIPYATSQVGAHNAYLYSPAFLQAMAPLRAMPWQDFMAAWTAVLIGAALFLVGPVLLGPAVLLAVPEILGGNITLLIAVAVVVGLRWPAAWAFVLLTKVTPGVGLVWFAVRREWRSLGVAAIATLVVIAGSYLLAPPGVWNEWVAVLLGNVGRPIESGSLPVPILVRLPLAVLVIAWGAIHNRRWVLPIGCLLALPVIWYGSLSLLVAIVALVRIPRLADWHWPAVIAEVREWWAGIRASAAPAGR